MTPYVICTTPRSGSWMLCSLLAQTGVAGNPQEYFGQTLIEELRIHAHIAHTQDIGEYLDRVTELGASSNGVFGMKLMAQQTRTFVRRASERKGAAFDSLRTALESVYPGIRYILLTRQNKVAQAISFYRALTDQVWKQRSPDPPRARTVPYDHFSIQRCYQEVLLSDAYWAGYFTRHSIEPHRIDYEELAGDHERETRRVLAYLGLDEAVPLLPPETVKQSGSESVAWELEFRTHGRIPEAPLVQPERVWAPY